MFEFIVGILLGMIVGVLYPEKLRAAVEWAKVKLNNK